MQIDAQGDAPSDSVQLEADKKNKQMLNSVEKLLENQSSPVVFHVNSSIDSDEQTLDNQKYYEKRSSPRQNKPLPVEINKQDIAESLSRNMNSTFRDELKKRQQKSVKTMSEKFGFGMSSKLTKKTNQLAELKIVDTEDMPTRSVSTDYPIPKWIIKKKILTSTYKAPFKYARTFYGKFGLINFDVVGNIEDPLVVCFHGLNASRYTFKEISDVCSTYKYCMINFDLYGHGLSANAKFHTALTTKIRRSKKPEPYSLQFFVEQTEEILEHLNLESRRLTLLGFSMGGLIAVAYALKHVQLIDRIILISTAGLLSEKIPLSIHCLRMCQCFIPLSSRRLCSFCFNKKDFFKTYQQDTTLAEFMWNRQMWQLFVKKGVLQTMLGSICKLPLWEAKKLFTKVGNTGIPVLLLWGKNDQVAPVASALKVKSCFPNSHLIIFDKASHLLIADRAQAVICLILTFLTFPQNCSIKDYKHLFQYTEEGVYNSKEYQIKKAA